MWIWRFLNAEVGCEEFLVIFPRVWHIIEKNGRNKSLKILFPVDAVTKFVFEEQNEERKEEIKSHDYNFN